MEKTLYSINEQYLDLLRQIEENGGEVTPELEEQLAINEADHAAKLEAYGRIISNYTAEAAACMEEVKRLALKADRATRAAGRLKDTILYFLQATDRRKAAAGVWTYTLRDSKAVEVEDDSALPEEFWRVREVRTPDKQGIKAAIEAGATVPGARLVTNTSLQMR